MYLLVFAAAGICLHLSARCEAGFGLRFTGVAVIVGNVGELRRWMLIRRHYLPGGGY